MTRDKEVLKAPGMKRGNIPKANPCFVLLLSRLELLKRKNKSSGQLAYCGANRELFFDNNTKLTNTKKLALMPRASGGLKMQLKNRKRPIKVNIIFPYNRVGGAFRSTYEIANRLLERDYDVQVYFPFFPMLEDKNIVSIIGLRYFMRGLARSI